jgi:hypothetical protein
MPLRSRQVLTNYRATGTTEALSAPWLGVHLGERAIRAKVVSQVSSRWGARSTRGEHVARPIPATSRQAQIMDVPSDYGVVERWQMLVTYDLMAFSAAVTWLLSKVSNDLTSVRVSFKKLYFAAASTETNLLK